MLAGPGSRIRQPITGGHGAARRASVRPFLRIRRTTTEQVCAELGLEPWQDPHNSDRRFTRVRVRDIVLPMLEAELGPGVAEALSRTAELVRDDSEFLDRLAAETSRAAEDWAVRTPSTVPPWNLKPPALRRRIIRLWLLSPWARRPLLRHISAVDSLVIDWHGQRPSTSRARRSRVPPDGSGSED